MLLMQITGRVGGDAEAVKVNDQWAIRFSVCHSFQYTDASGQKKDVATWVRCTMWKKNDKMAQYIRKGDVVYCAGKPKTHAWIDQNKQVRSALELTVDDFEFVHSKRDDNSNGYASQPSNDPARQPSSQPPANPDDWTF